MADPGLCYAGQGAALRRGPPTGAAGRTDGAPGPAPSPPPMGLRACSLCCQAGARAGSGRSGRRRPRQLRSLPG
eukprot:14385660-Alexandrium_andersonii.AAC.1